MNTTHQLGEAADEADWRTLVEKGLKGAPWERLVSRTADGIEIQPLFREPDSPSANDASGFPGAAPFVRGRAGWTIRQAFAHPDPARVNQDILADLSGGVASIELVVDQAGISGVAIKNAADLDRALADVVLEAAPVSLDAHTDAMASAELLRTKLRGVAAAGTAFNLDPVTAPMRTTPHAAFKSEALAFVARHAPLLPAATFVRADARPVHEAGGSEAQEIATAITSGIEYLRALEGIGFTPAEANARLAFAVALGPNVLIEAAKLRALRLAWARVMQAAGAAPRAREAQIHAFTSRRMLTRYDAHTNILRVTTAAFGAAIGGANVITTGAFTDALGLPTPFARRVARNTQNILMEECRLDHVADAAGGAWFVERLTRDLANKAWKIVQTIEAKGGFEAALADGFIRHNVSQARSARQKQFATRRETITGVTDFPLLDAAPPAFEPASPRSASPSFEPIRWAAPFERLRERADATAPRRAVFLANIGVISEFGARAQWTSNLLAVGGVAAIGSGDAYGSIDAIINAFTASGARVAAIASTDAHYAESAADVAKRLKAAGADWVLLAGKPGAGETALRAAGIDQFLFTGVDTLHELETVQVALGIAQ